MTPDQSSPESGRDKIVIDVDQYQNTNGGFHAWAESAVGHQSWLPIRACKFLLEKDICSTKSFVSCIQRVARRMVTKPVAGESKNALAATVARALESYIFARRLFESALDKLATNDLADPG